MAYDQKTVRILYKKLLTLYPRGFRQRLSESMEQTFNDLYKEQQTERGLFGFVFWMFVETGVGIFKEHLLLIAEGNTMKSIISNPISAAITSLILSLPLGLPFVAFMYDIESLTVPFKSLLTVNGYDVNILGRIVLIGGLLLLPLAFVLNLQPLLKREEPEGKRRLHAINLIVGVVILLFIIYSWGGLLVEEIYCLRGVRCD